MTTVGNAPPSDGARMSSGTAHSSIPQSMTSVYGSLTTVTRPAVSADGSGLAATIDGPATADWWLANDSVA